MSGQVKLVWGEDFMRYRLSEDHPLQPVRVKLAVELMLELGLLDHAEVAPPRQAAAEELELCHSRRYVEVVERLSDPATRAQVPGALVGASGFASPDNPIADGMHEACAYVVGGSLVAAEAVASGAALHAFNPAGGLHHASRDRAHGFCVYNDVAVAAAWLRSQGHRVAVVDVDVHHGDGTQALFYEDPDVLTISLHESGRYLFPGTGFTDETGAGRGKGAAANLPLLPYTWDEPWLRAFDFVVPALLRRFRPTVLVTQDGCDTHFLDPLAHLHASTAIWPHVGRCFHELAHELCEGRWVATGGGGYALREVVPRAWSLLFAEMVERPNAARELIDRDPFPPPLETQARVWSNLEDEMSRLSKQLELAIRAPGTGKG